MIEHVVLFKLRESASAEQKAGMLENLLKLKGKIPGIVQAAAGPNFSARSRGYTHGFVARFADRAALDSYQPHPEHQAVVRDHVQPIAEEILVVDYEISAS